MDLSVNPRKTAIVPFTNKRKLDNLIEPTLFGEQIEFSNQVKYLGIILDSKLTWNAHIDYITNKGRNIFWACRRAYGQTWGLKPHVVKWLYTAVVRSMLTFSAVAWWPKVAQKTAREKLNKNVWVSQAPCERHPLPQWKYCWEYHLYTSE